MAASANPSANTDGSTSNGNGTATTTTNNNINNDDWDAVGPSERALKHQTSLSAVWSRDEESLFEEFLAKYASDSKVLLFARIAEKLQNKTIRDVALRFRWMTCPRPLLLAVPHQNFLFFTHKYDPDTATDTAIAITIAITTAHSATPFEDSKKKKNGKRKKDDNNSSRKQKDKREKVADQQAKPTSHATNRANGLPHAQSSTSMDCDDGISYRAIGGLMGQLLEQNAQALDQISANFSALKLHENISLLCQTRNNIATILNDLHDMPEVMKQMPPLPVKLNEELANSILP